ncbi:helix-turn-helix domain-containing protein [Baekduia sp.]|jgi:hypothetical protein|uniref:helix-turn-helix domain-containing protein n=1 Tax=Baekduia sp. TaxID=2600305 RepID=UPI002E0252D1|nr:helix-turn-helix domain-containing protein [Baekduia sp.]
MSLRAVEWVLKHAPRHGGAKRAVLVALAWHADNNGEDAFPSQETWASKAGMGERSLRRIVAALEADGEIERDGHRPGGGTVRWRIVGLAGPANSGRTDDPANGGRTDPADVGRTTNEIRSGQRAPSGPANGRRSVRPTGADNTSLTGPDTSELPSAAEGAAPSETLSLSTRGRTDVAGEASRDDTDKGLKRTDSLSERIAELHTLHCEDDAPSEVGRARGAA